jgi:hypothetical protein
MASDTDEPVETEVTERELSRDEGKAAVAAARDALKQALAASKGDQ